MSFAFFLLFTEKCGERVRLLLWQLNVSVNQPQVAVLHYGFEGGSLFFSNWEGLFRVVVVGLLAYAALLLWLRLAGKRTLSKWNAFDLVVTVALGSTLATVVLSKQVALAEGVLGFALLIVLQFVITWLSVRSPVLQRLIKAEPTLLLMRGRFLHQAMKSQRVTESEVRAAVRAAGIAALEEVYAVVLETDGSFSVIKQAASEGDSALADVANIEDKADR